jgi:uncharacterized protein YkwD
MAAARALLDRAHRHPALILKARAGVVDPLRVRAAVALLLLLALALAGCGSASQASAPEPDVDGCAGSWLRPTAANGARVRAATLCLINAQRTRHGDQPLTENVMLDRAAVLHSVDMAKRKYFEHVDPDGVHPDARIVQQGYPPILVGENLAWGETSKSSPAWIVSAWMKSPGHRDNILEPGYREIGIGMAYEAPEPQPVPKQAAIYTTTFGAGGR